MSNYIYKDRMLEIIDQAFEVNADKIETAVDRFVETIIKDKIIHAFGTGHSLMIGLEMFDRASGLANVEAMVDPDCTMNFGTLRSGRIERVEGLADIIYDNYLIDKGDIMIISSNSGRNAVPIEMAMRCKKEGIYTIAVTSLRQSQNMKSRHSSGRKLYEICDLVLDNCAPDGDGCLITDGVVNGSVSSVSGMMLMNTIVTEAIKRCVDRGYKPYIYNSGNVDWADNTATYLHFKGRIRDL